MTEKKFSDAETKLDEARELGLYWQTEAECLIKEKNALEQILLGQSQIIKRHLDAFREILKEPGAIYACNIATEQLEK